MADQEKAPLIHIDQLTWWYSDQQDPVFANFSFQLDESDFAVLVWKSGTGKSTLVKMIMGSFAVPAKTVYHRNEDMAKMTRDERQLYRRKVGLVLQDDHLLHWKTARENIAYPLHIAELGEELMQIQMQKVVDLLQLHDYIDQQVGLVSGGHREKIALARALVLQPEFLVLDEPTGNLDWEDTKNIADILIKLNSQWTTVLLVTHDVHLIEYIKLKQTVKLHSL